MTYKLKIKVTKEILEKSKMCGLDGKTISNSCAIALACQEIFPKCTVSRLYISDQTPFGLNYSYRIPINKEIREFIREFDNSNIKERLNLPEFEFEVELTESYINSINIDEIKELLKNSKTLELV